MLESGENYLETILLLQNRNGYVRSIDIANELGFTKPSISRAMSILKKDEYIVMERNGRIHLTQKGIQKAESVYERHTIITQFLIIALDVDNDTASQDACRIEHVISEKSFEQIKKFVQQHNHS